MPCLNPRRIPGESQASPIVMRFTLAVTQFNIFSLVNMFPEIDPASEPLERRVMQKYLNL